MARTFGGTDDYVALGDVQTGPGRFQVGSAWTSLAMFRTSDTDADDNAIIGKWDPEEGGDQYLSRIDKGAADQPLSQHDQ